MVLTDITREYNRTYGFRYTEIIELQNVFDELNYRKEQVEQPFHEGVLRIEIQSRLLLIDIYSIGLEQNQCYAMNTIEVFTRHIIPSEHNDLHMQNFGKICRD